MSEEEDSLPPRRPGTYTLILRVPRSVNIQVGALGLRHFSRGFYTYTGSALGRSQNLRNRVARHLRGVKKRRWHIDYLLGHGEVKRVVFCTNPIGLECQLIWALGMSVGIEVAVRGFGSSDCAGGCRAHLYHHPRRSLQQLVELVCQIYNNAGCRAEVLRTGAE